MSKVSRLVLALIVFFVAVTMNTNTTFAQNVDDSLYWNKGNILIRKSERSHGNLEDCRLTSPIKKTGGVTDTGTSYFGARGAGDTVKRSLQKCIREGNYSTTLKDYLGNSSKAKVRIRTDKNSNEHQDTIYLDYAKDAKVSCKGDEENGSFTAIRCDYQVTIPTTNNLISNGFDNGEIFFVQEGGNHGVYFNGAIQRADAQYSSATGKSPIGKVSLTWQENYFYTEMDKKYISTRDKYIENCNKNIDEKIECAKTKERAFGAFTQIWRSCVVSTGTPEADFQNSSNCIKDATGVKINIASMLANTPSNVTSLEDVNTCGIDIAGYIFCPIMRFLAGASDKMFDLMQSLLHISPLDTSQPGGQSAKRAWGVFLNLANVVFVILFIIVILSQVTNFGINDYGVKKILPRIIVGAILVNSSFYLCLAAIDLSNILGDSIQKVMVTINESVSPATGEDIILTADMTGSNSAGTGDWETLTNTILATGVIAGAVAGTAALIFTFIPVMTAVVLSGVTVVLTLMIRYGMILTLTILAPIAFALYLLPNTKKWFSKWRSLFTSLLMLYPILSIVFGLSTLSANIVMQVASSTNAQMLAMFALAIQSIPFAITPLILKSSGEVLGNIGNKIQNNSLFSRGRSYAKDKQSTVNKRLQARALDGKFVPYGSVIRMNAKRGAVNKKRKGMLRKLESDFISGYLNGSEGSGGEKIGIRERAKSLITGKEAKTNSEKLQDRMTVIGGEGSKDRALAFAISSQHNILTDEIKAEKLKLSGKSADHSLTELTGSGKNAEDADPDPVKFAHIEKVSEKGDSLESRVMIESTGNMSKAERLHAATNSAKNNIFMRNPEAQREVASSGITDRADFNRRVVEKTVMSESFTPGMIAGMNREERQILFESASDLSSTAQARLGTVARQSRANSKITESFSAEDHRQFDNLGRTL